MTDTEFARIIEDAHAEAIAANDEFINGQLENSRQNTARDEGCSYHAHNIWTYRPDTFHAGDPSWDSETSGTFHWKGGLYFFRMKCGCVAIVLERLSHRAGGTFGLPDRLEANWLRQIVGVIPTMQWASIVASMSAGGETAERWEAATAFHRGSNA